MRLSDQQIERYSRQIILAEVGAEGQTRLLAASVGIVGEGAAAERVVAYLAAAGVGRLAATPALHGSVDPHQKDVTLDASPPPRRAAEFDAIVLCGDAALDPAPWTAAPHVLWTADGIAAELPPCVTCATAATSIERRAGTERLADLRDGMLGSVLATEVVKTVLGIGTSMRGRVIAYDPSHARIVIRAVAPLPSCRTCGARVA